MPGNSQSSMCLHKHLPEKQIGLFILNSFDFFSFPDFLLLSHPFFGISPFMSIDSCNVFALRTGLFIWI